MKPPAFGELLEVIQRDVIRVASHYPLVTGLFFKLMNQPKLVQQYPWLLPDLFLAVTGDMVMTLGRLLEKTNNPRTACLTTFLTGVPKHHAHDVNVRPNIQARRTAFIGHIDTWLREIRAAERRLAARRNADLAHNDLTKVGRSDITWLEIKDMVALATSILKAYFHAFQESDQTLVLRNVEWELDDFLKWCRLDDYEAHRARERDARRAAFDKGRRPPPAPVRSSS